MIKSLRFVKYSSNYGNFTYLAQGFSCYSLTGGGGEWGVGTCVRKKALPTQIAS